MRFKNYFVISFLAGVLAGCGSMPKTPDLLVQNANDSKMYSEKDVFEVKRPISQVTTVLKEKSAECLQRKIESRWREGGLNRRQVTALTPKVEVSKDHTQLTLQTKTVEGSTDLGDIPADGWYIMVVNAYPKDKSTTRVESYFQYTAYKTAFTAIKPWVTGSNLGCPDLTQ